MNNRLELTREEIVRLGEIKERYPKANPQQSSCCYVRLKVEGYNPNDIPWLIEKLEERLTRRCLAKTKPQWHNDEEKVFQCQRPAVDGSKYCATHEKLKEHYDKQDL